LKELKGIVLNKINTYLLQIMRANKAFCPNICVLCHQNKKSLSQKKNKKKEENLRVTYLYDALYMCGREWLNIVMKTE
jgi:hypothetical protein